MEKNQIITIAITAIVSVIAKEVISWILSLIKLSETTKNFKNKIKIIFIKKNRVIFSDILAIVFYIGVLVNFSLSGSQPTRLDILIAIGATIALIPLSIGLLIRLSNYNTNK